MSLRRQNIHNIVRLCRSWIFLPLTRMKNPEAEDDVKGRPLEPHEVKTARHKDIQYLWGRDCTSAPPKRKHGHVRDATHPAPSGSIPAEVAPKLHATLASGVYRGAPQRGRTDLLCNTAHGSSASFTLCCVSGRRFSRRRFLLDFNCRCESSPFQR